MYSLEERIADLIGNRYWWFGIGKSDEWCRRLARETIEIMREPTDEMVKAGEAIVSSGWPVYECSAKDVWQAMIDAAFAGCSHETMRKVSE